MILLPVGSGALKLKLVLSQFVNWLKQTHDDLFWVAVALV